MADKSILERGSKFRDDIEQGLAFCRVTRVYPDERMCEIKVFGASGYKNDTSIPKCQWISMDANPDGDESSAIPRVNSYGIVAFIEGEPFILGFFKPLNSSGTAANGEDLEELNEGDRVIKTIGRNKVIMRASGEIQIESTRTCRTIYFPERHIINTLCRNYEFRTDGGTVDWIHIDENQETQDTVLREEVRDDINRTNIILTESGKTARGSDVMYRRQFGKGVNGDGIDSVVNTTEIKNTGETDVFIRAANAQSGHKLNVKPSGETTLNIGDRMSANIKPTGETTLDVGPGKAKVNIKPSGETVVDVGPGKSTITIKPNGEIEVKTSAKIQMTSPKINLNQPKSGVTTANSHQNVIDFVTGVPVTPSKTVFSDI